MPIIGPVSSQLNHTDFVQCNNCYINYNNINRQPVSIGCGHNICKLCLLKISDFKCPIDQSALPPEVHSFPVNHAVLQLLGVPVPTEDGEDDEEIGAVDGYIQKLALLLKPILDGENLPSSLSRSIQRKLVSVVSCQVNVATGQVKAVKAARSLVERCVTELILRHQTSQQVASSLWAAVRARGCQFLGPAMQEQVLFLLLLALHDGSFLSRKVLVVFVVHKLDASHSHVSKTAVGHVVQLLYRASCFKVTKRDDDSSLMQLKEEFRTYETLRREHDSQVVTIAMEAGLRISPEQWSSLLYGDIEHRSHMQSIIDKLQGPQSLQMMVQELQQILHKTGDPVNMLRIQTQLEKVAGFELEEEPLIGSSKQ